MKKADLLEHIDLIRGAVMICFPMGLPEWDNVRAAIEDKEDLEGTSVRTIPYDNGICVFDLQNNLVWGSFD